MKALNDYFAKVEYVSVECSECGFNHHVDFAKNIEAAKKSIKADGWRITANRPARPICPTCCPKVFA